MTRGGLHLLLPLAILACSGADPDEPRLGFGCNPHSHGVVDQDGDGYGSTLDCDDSDPQVHPHAEERCNGRDDDCDEEVDEDAPALHHWYVDQDGDDWGRDGDTLPACSRPEGYAGKAGDCDDRDPEIHPMAAEVCDGEDQDCDDVIDEDAIDAVVRYDDVDGDGYGDPDTERSLCEDDGQGTTLGGDCDDSLASVNPGQPETCCDGLDNDCDVRPDQPCSGDVGRWGRTRDQLLARALAGAGDTEGDGRVELLVGATYGAWRIRGDAASTAGDAIIDASMGTEFYGGTAVSFGEGVAGLGDTNQDGMADLVISEPGGNSGVARGGVVYLFRGPLEDSESYSSWDAKILGDVADGHFGGAVAAAGDVNGDGLADLWVGSQEYGVADTARDLGRAWLFHAPIEGELSVSAAQATITGDGHKVNLGVAVAGAGDLDGDGLDDLLVSYDRSRGGKVGVLHGPVRGDLAVEDLAAFVASNDPKARFGMAVVGAGDVDRDGLADFVVGAPSQGLEGGGAVYLFLGPSARTGTVKLAAARFEGPHQGEALGTAVAADFDWDRDGWPDLAAGAPSGSLACDSDAGLVYLWVGPHSGVRGPDQALRVFQGVAEGVSLGAAVASPGDLDGDGFDDLAMGAPRSALNGIDSGALWIAFGGPD